MVRRISIDIQHFPFSQYLLPTRNHDDLCADSSQLNWKNNHYRYPYWGLLHTIASTFAILISFLIIHSCFCAYCRSWGRSLAEMQYYEVEVLAWSLEHLLQMVPIAIALSFMCPSIPLWTIPWAEKDLVIPDQPQFNKALDWMNIKFLVPWYFLIPITITKWIVSQLTATLNGNH